MEFGKLKKASKRVTKEEKYDYPVMTVHTKPEKGFSNKVSFNKAAIKEFGFEEGGKLAFAFDGDSLFCKIGEDAYTVTKTEGTISDKSLCEALWEHFEVDGTEEIELAIYEEADNIYGFNNIDILDNTSEENNSDNDYYSDMTGESVEDYEEESTITSGII